MSDILTIEEDARRVQSSHTPNTASSSHASATRTTRRSTAAWARELFSASLDL